ncbi:MAG: mercuric transport protein [Betaproteobacteria bacterium]|nr:mercuric transport protein [Betaproteobacteria bacterium]
MQGPSSAGHETAGGAAIGQERAAAGSLAGGVLAAIGASLCCMGPLVLVTLGIGGSWLANLAALTPYRPYFLGAAAVFLALAFRKIYLVPATGGQACSAGAACAVPGTRRAYRILFWMVVALTALSFASTSLIQLFY